MEEFETENDQLLTDLAKSRAAHSAVLEQVAEEARMRTENAASGGTAGVSHPFHLLFAMRM
jgi:hypothetical protein